MTIFETIRRHQELAEAAAEWKRTRVEVALASTSPAYTGREVADLLRDHEAAIAALLVAQDALEDTQLPALTIGNARRIGQLEGEIALAAIGWFRHREEGGDTVYARERAAECEQLMHESVRELVGELTRLGAPA